LAAALAKLGNKDAAKRELQTVVSGPGFSEMNQARALLDDLNQ
jgi:hypothetical protein